MCSHGRTEAPGWRAHGSVPCPIWFPRGEARVPIPPRRRAAGAAGDTFAAELSGHRPLLRPSSPRLHTGMDAYGGLRVTHTTRTTDDRACLRWGAQCLGHEETLTARPKRRTHTPMSQDSPFN